MNRRVFTYILLAILSINLMVVACYTTNVGAQKESNVNQSSHSSASIFNTANTMDKHSTPQSMNIGSAIQAIPPPPTNNTTKSTSESGPMAVNVHSFYSKEPAPMGIADYGIGQNGAYQYATNSFIGIATINSLSTKTSNNNPSMTIQLNVNLQFTSNSIQYTYWIQDVAFIDTSSNNVSFENNIWNMSASSSILSQSSITGSGSVYNYKAEQYYACGVSSAAPGNDIYLQYPAAITLNVTCGLNTASKPSVSFAYEDGFGLVTYDTVTFTTVYPVTSFSGFMVNGNSYNPRGAFYNAELALGGPGGGSSTQLLQSNVQLQLEYWNDHNYQMITNAYNFGETGETISNTLSQSYYNPSTGQIIAYIQPGSGSLITLYYQSNVGVIDIKSSLASGTLSVTNASTPNASPWQTVFINGEVTITIIPGYYNLKLYQNGVLYDQVNCTISAGQTRSLCQVTFGQSGLDSSTASGKVLTVNSTDVAYTGLPYTVWVNSGDRLVYAYNTTVASTTAGKQFVGGTASPSSPLVNIQGAQTVTANWQTFYSLTTNIIGAGSVLRNPNQATYASDSVVNLTAQEYSGWAFSSWSGDLSGNANPAQITMNSPKNVTATFTEVWFSLTTNVVGNGSVSRSPNQPIFAPGTVVTLTANPASGWIFSGWSGALSGSANPANITMGNSDVTVTATFTQQSTLDYLVVRGENNQIYYRAYNATAATWTSWTGLPGTTGDPPAATVINNELHIVVRGSNGGQIWHGYVNLADNTFSGWELLSGATPSAPTLTGNGTHLCLVVRGNNNNIYYRFYTLTTRTWTGWTAVPSGTTTTTPAAVLTGSTLQVVVQGSNYNQIWHGYVNLPTGTFSGWILLDGATPSPPTLTSNGTSLCLVVRGNTNNVYYRFYNLMAQTWAGWTSFPYGTTPDTPAATITDNTLQIVVRGTNYNQIWYGNLQLTTDTWSGWTMLDGSTPSKPVLTS